LVSFCALFIVIIPARVVRFVSLSLSVSFPPPNETKCRERNSEDIPPTFCEVIDDAFADDAFADDDD